MTQTAASTWREAGFFGKIPARGDFVQRGLSQAFVAGWDEWMSRVLADSKDALGRAWLAAWMEAPVWNFLLAPGICGPDAVLGVFMPSIDSVGRHFPLTLARQCGATSAMPEQASAWLAEMEAAGIAALEESLNPDQLSDRLHDELPALDPLPDLPQAACRWWTIGAPRVPANAFVSDQLPNPSRFARMLDAGSSHATLSAEE